jgi:hypothetical protein
MTSEGKVLHPGNSELIKHLDGSPVPSGTEFDIAVQDETPTAERPQEEIEEEQEEAGGKNGTKKEEKEADKDILSVVTLPGEELEWGHVILHAQIAIAQKKAAMLVITREAGAGDTFHRIVGRDNS